MKRSPIDEKILERIRRLFAMAKDSSSPNEAAIAARRAQKLVEEHNLDNVESILGDLEDDDSLGEERITKFKVAANSKKVAREVPLWVNRLAVSVSRLFDCQVKIVSAAEQTGVYGSKAIAFFGYKTDLTVCKWTFEFLLDQIRRFNRRARDEYGTGNRAKLGDYRDGLITGIHEVIAEALKAKKEAAQANSTGTALIVVKQDAIAKKYGDFNYTSRPTRLSDHDAYSRGIRDGRSINLSQPLSGPTNKLIR